MRSNNRGFTLIELMMVIAIIGILASIALPSYQAYLYRAKAADVVMVLDKLHTVLGGFQAEKGTVNQPYCVNSTDTAPSSVTAALTYFAKFDGATPRFEKGDVSGMHRSELNLNSVGVGIRVSTCSTHANAPGQYLVVIKPLNAGDIQARQVALAVQHVMQAQAYKTMATSSGYVLLYFQI